MKDLLSKEHYCYKTQTLLMKSNGYLLFYRQPHYMGYTPNYYKKILIPPSMIFQKSQPPLTINKGVHTEYYI